MDNSNGNNYKTTNYSFDLIFYIYIPLYSLLLTFSEKSTY